MINKHQRQYRCLSEPKINQDYPFYMRQLEKNIIYQHQKYKLFRKKTLSLTKKAPFIYKSTKQTAIDFQEISFNAYGLNSVRENNGNLLYNFFNKTRIQSFQQQTRIKKLKIVQETQQKMKLFINKIQQKKNQKKRQDSSKKSNLFYKKFLQYQGLSQRSTYSNQLQKDKKVALVSQREKQMNFYKMINSQQKIENYKKLQCF